MLINKYLFFPLFLFIAVYIICKLRCSKDHSVHQINTHQGKVIIEFYFAA